MHRGIGFGVAVTLFCLSCGGQSDSEFYDNQTDELMGDCTITNVTFSPSPRQPTLGSPVQISATATCAGSVTPKFRFWAVSPETGSSLSWCQWGLSNTCNVPTGNLTEEGYYQVKVLARRQGQASAEASVTQRYAIGAVCSAVSLTISPATSAIVGTNVHLAASATCDSGVTPGYKFDVQDIGGTWHDLSGWQASNGFTWSTVSWLHSSYNARVRVIRAKQSSADVSITKPYALTCSGPLMNEICDGLDNDCDGLVDEVCFPAGGVTL